MFYRDDVHAVLCRGCDAMLVMASGAWYDAGTSTVCIRMAEDHLAVYHEPMPVPLKGAPPGGNNG